MTQQIAIWKNQHSNFFCLLDVLDSQIRIFHAAARPDYELMLDVSDYLIEYADRFHHAKEDVAIGLLLRRAPEAQTLATQLNDEHHAIAQKGLVLRERLHTAVAGLMMPRRDLERMAGQHAAYYRTHMWLEEAELFPRLEHYLDESDWAALERAVPYPDPLSGKPAQERYEALRRRIVRTVGGAACTAGKCQPVPA